MGISKNPRDQTDIELLSGEQNSESVDGGHGKKFNPIKLIILLTLLCLIIAPWIWIGMLAYQNNLPNYREHTVDLSCEDVTYVSCSTDETCLKAAKKIMDVCPAIDTHNDLPWTFLKYQMGPQITKEGLNYGINFDVVYNNMNGAILNKEESDSHTSIPLMKQGRLFGQFWAAYIPCNTNNKDAVEWGLQQIDIIKELINAYPEFEFSTDPWHTKALMNEGKIASMMGMEGGHMIGSRLGVLRQMFDLGIRYLTLTHNCNTPWADNNLADSNHTLARSDGLSIFGTTVIKEMNRIGMFVDLSHVSTKTMLDALETSEAPVMFSHSGARAVADHARNVPDDVLLKVKENNGVVCIVFYSPFVSNSFNKTDPATTPGVADVANHFDYIKNLIGAEHLCLGADYNGVPHVPTGLENVSGYPNLIAELLKRKWTQSEIQGVLQENVLRAWKDVYEVAEKIKKQWPRGRGQFISDYDFKENELSCKTLYPFIE